MTQLIQVSILQQSLQVNQIVRYRELRVLCTVPHCGEPERLVDVMKIL